MAIRRLYWYSVSLRVLSWFRFTESGFEFSFKTVAKSRVDFDVVFVIFIDFVGSLKLFLIVSDCVAIDGWFGSRGYVSEGKVALGRLLSAVDGWVLEYAFANYVTRLKILSILLWAVFGREVLGVDSDGVGYESFFV